jgi:hypothetical protein
MEMRGEELRVFAENKPGTLARVCSALASVGVNIRALVASDQAGLLHMVTTDLQRATETLERSGYQCERADVVLLEVEDKMGVAAEVSRRLADSGINIDWAYTGTATGDKALVVIGTGDLGAAEKALTDIG